jgi:hypothetical protein
LSDVARRCSSMAARSKVCIEPRGSRCRI